MRTVAQAVRRVIESDNTALEALERGVLNLTAYGREIQNDVQEWLWKDVTTSSVVVALSRYGLQKRPTLLPEICICDMTIQTGIRELVFENTQSVQTMLAELGVDQRKRKQFYVFMQGMQEVSILMKKSALTHLKPSLLRACKKELTDLVAITVRMEDHVIDQSNVFYALMKPFIAKKIPIIEIMTGVGEITFVVHEKDQGAAVEGLRSL